MLGVSVPLSLAGASLPGARDESTKAAIAFIGLIIVDFTLRLHVGSGIVVGLGVRDANVLIVQVADGKGIEGQDESPTIAGGLLLDPLNRVGHGGGKFSRGAQPTRETVLLVVSSHDGRKRENCENWVRDKVKS